MNSRKHIEFDLLSNAKDSLRQAVQLLTSADIGSDHARLKHSIVASAHCVELLLKERLRRIHPAFVWENVERYPSLDARTVTVDVAIARLRSIGNATLSKDDERSLKSLRATRNAIEHYEWRTTEREAKTIVGNALSFSIAFARFELGVDLAADFKSDDTWQALLDDVHDFAISHAERLNRHIAATSILVYDCTNCGNQTVPLESSVCELCGHWVSLPGDDD